MKQGRTHGQSPVTRELFMGLFTGLGYSILLPQSHRPQGTSSAKGSDGHAEPAQPELRTVVPKKQAIGSWRDPKPGKTGWWADYARRGTAKAEKDEHGGSRTDGS